MQILKKMEWMRLKHEYGVDGDRLLPWPGGAFPFGGAWCIVRPGSQSLYHVNEPDDEDELFIAISGTASVTVGESCYLTQKGDIIFIPAGTPHYITNDSEEEFHFYTIWWNSEILATTTNSKVHKD